MLRLMVASTVREKQAWQDRCLDLGGHASEGNIHEMFIDMSLYNNFDEAINTDLLWKKIEFMIENKNAMNRVSVFREIVRLRY